MKHVLLIAPLLAIGTTGCGMSEPNVYALPAAEVYTRLAAAQIDRSARGPFGTREFTVSRMAPDRVSWSSSSSHDGRRCDATIVPVSDTSSRVDLACGSRAAGGGVSSPMEVNQTRKALIELIDSTLEGRPYDHRLARGSTAAGWPKHALKAAS